MGPLSDPPKVGVELTSGGSSTESTADGGAACKPTLSQSLSGSPCIEAASNELIGAAAYVPVRGGKVWNRDDWLPIGGEPWWHYLRRLGTEGHTVPDAFLTAAAAQIGQVMLNTPSALYKSGLISGGITMGCFLIMGLWTIYILTSLYHEMKATKIKDGTWFETNGRHVRVVQFYEVMTFALGRWAMTVTVIIGVIALIGIGTAQIVACANDMYFIDNSRSKREWALIFGGIMVFTVTFVPRFTHFRLLNIIAILGTGATAIYLLADATGRGFNFATVNNYPHNAQQYFNGAAVLLACLGTHAVVFETMEAMEQPRHYKSAFLGAWMWANFLIIPPSVTINLAYGPYMKLAENVFALTPLTTAKRFCVIMMIIHQFVAFALYVTPLCYLMEKGCRVHTRPWYIRLPVRVPVSGFIWFLALLAPYYGAINTLYASIATPALGFVLPCLAHAWYFRTQERRDAATAPPWKIFRWRRWTSVFAINIFLIAIFLGFAGVSIYYAILSIEQLAATWGPFPDCYLCPPKRSATGFPPPPPPLSALGH